MLSVVRRGRETIDAPQTSKMLGLLSLQEE